MAHKNMVVGLLKVFPPNGVCIGCVLGKHHQAPFDLAKHGNHKTSWKGVMVMFVVQYTFLSGCEVYFDLY
jgi:hypothetical protein